MPSEPDFLIPDERPRRRWGLWLILALVAALIVAYAWRVVSLNHEVDTELAAIRAAGYPTNYVELNDWYALPLGPANAAPAWLAAFAAMKPLDSDADSLVPIVGVAEWPEGSAPVPEAMGQAISAYLAKNREALARLHQAAELPDARYPIDLTQGPATLLPHLAPLRAAARLLSLDAHWQAEAQATDEVVRDVQTSLLLGDSLRREPLLISQLVRIAVRAIAVRAIERAMNRAALSEPQCVALQQAFAAVSDPGLMTTALAGERAACAGNIQGIGSGAPASFATPVASTPARLLWQTTGLYQKDLLATLRLLTEQMEATRLPYGQAQVVADRQDREIAQLPRTRFLTKMMMPALSRAFAEGAADLARLSLAHTALAVERYHWAHGALPENLAALVPDYLDAVPADPFDGQPLRYVRTEKGFKVYSIGQDRKDDGGTRRSPDKQTWDEVFSVEREARGVRP